MAQGMPPFSERLKDVTVHEIVANYDTNGNLIDAQVNCDDLEGASVWFLAKLAPEFRFRPQFVSGARPPKFTGNFDPPDYEAFYLEITSRLGIDESVTCERSAKMVNSALDNLSVMANERLWRIVYYHKMAGATDEAYVRASASGNALIKFAGTCAQPDLIDIRSCEEVEVTD